MAMSSSPIICRPTKDTFVRFFIILAAVWGFALYFFYDGSIGYHKKNAAYFSFKAFADGGSDASLLSANEWRNKHQGSLFDTIDGFTYNRDENQMEAAGKTYPLPSAASLEYSSDRPAEFLDHAMMSTRWNDAWRDFSSRNRYPLKPGDKPYDQATVDEQWIAGGVCVLLGGIILYFIIRTSRRVLSLEGTEVKAIGQSFKVSDISRIDLRQWGPGFKGVAFFTVHGKKLKIDGMTYGGFGSKNEAPAEKFMQALLAVYQGELVEYAADEDEAKDETKDEAKATEESKEAPSSSSTT